MGAPALATACTSQSPSTSWPKQAGFVVVVATTATTTATPAAPTSTSRFSVFAPAAATTAAVAADSRADAHQNINVVTEGQPWFQQPMLAPLSTSTTTTATVTATSIVPELHTQHTQHHTQQLQQEQYRASTQSNGTNYGATSFTSQRRSQRTFTSCFTYGKSYIFLHELERENSTTSTSRVLSQKLSNISGPKSRYGPQSVEETQLPNIAQNYWKNSTITPRRSTTRALTTKLLSTVASTTTSTRWTTALQQENRTSREEDGKSRSMGKI